MKTEKPRGSRTAKYTRLRLVQGAIAGGVLILGLLFTFHRIPGSIAWPIATGLILPGLFSEPYFAGPRAAIATGLGQVASFFAADRSSESRLWVLLLVVSMGVILSSVVAMASDAKPGDLSHWIATRVGRARVLGSIVVLILVIQVAHMSASRASGLAVTVLVIYGVLFLEWLRLTTLSRSPLTNEGGSVTAIFAPNQLLVQSSSRFDLGSRVEVTGTAGSCTGYVGEDLASEAGSQYRIVLDDHWRTVTGGGLTPCNIELVEEEPSAPCGFAIEGSTETTLRVNPARMLKIGETLQIADAEGPLLYQVAGLQLEEERWSSGAGIVTRSRLVQVGAVNEEGRIVVRPALPTPYQAVHDAASTTGGLSGGYMKIGVLKGTSIPVGIRKDWEANHGHLAVLGMSGMGKTTLATKLTGVPGAGAKFVILDETSEYRTRLGFNVTPMPELNWNVGDTTVCEPGGEMPASCARLIEVAMSAAQIEYRGHQVPRRRFILLEEAHGWLPEWNFTTKNNSDRVNESCRYILQARKFNMTFVIVSQRTAVISKSALSQCENYVILRTLDETSLDYVGSVVGGELRNVVPELGKYEAVCVGPIFNSDSPIVVSLDSAGA